MNQDYEEIGKMSPDALMRNFTQTPFLRGVMLAVGLHIILIAVTSVGYVYKTFFAVAPPPAAAAAEGAAGTAATNAAATVAATTNGAAVATAPGTGTAARVVHAAPGTEDAELAKYKDTPIVKAITEASTPEEIPASPDLGISLDETNPF